MKKIIIGIIFLGIAGLSHAQYVTKNAHIKFFSHAAAEDIEAHNHAVQTALKIQSGDLIFKVLIKSFEFKKALMQEHFNENYMESNKFPTATFSGKISNIAEFDLSKEGPQEVIVEGKLTIHGVTKEVTTKGSLQMEGESIHAKSVFKVLIADYDITIPKMVRNKIAKELEITVDAKLSELK